MENKEDYKSLYTSLKRKFSDLEDVKIQLDNAKKEIKKLSKEKKYLLDKLIQFEDVSSDSDSETFENNSINKLKNFNNNNNNINNHNNFNNNNNIYSNSINNNNINLNNVKKETKKIIDNKIDGTNLICIGKDNKPCKGKSLPGSVYCWHHAPLDPNTDFMYCKYISSNKKNNKKCNIPISKSKAVPYCIYHQSKELGSDLPTSTTPPHSISSGGSIISSSGVINNQQQQQQTILIKNNSQTPPYQSLPGSQNTTPPPSSEQLSPKHLSSEHQTKKIKIENANNSVISFQNVGNPEIPLPSISQSHSSGNKIIMPAILGGGFKQNIINGQPLSPNQQSQQQINPIKMDRMDERSPSKIQIPMSLSPQSKPNLISTPLSPNINNNNNNIIGKITNQTTQSEDIDILEGAN